MSAHRRAESRSGAVALVSIGLHAALLAALLRQPPPARPPSATPVVAVTLVSLAPARAASAAAAAASSRDPPPAEAEADEPGAEPSDAPPAGEPPSPREAAPSDPPAAPEAPPQLAAAVAGGCAVPSDVQAALQDEAVRAALQRIPPARRSVANAVMLWDGTWVSSGALSDPRVSGPLRQAIAAAVRRVGPGCAAAPIQGPMFFVVPEAAGALVLVVGSAEWRWSDLADPAKS